MVDMQALSKTIERADVAAILMCRFQRDDKAVSCKGLALDMSFQTAEDVNKTGTESKSRCRMLASGR